MPKTTKELLMNEELIGFVKLVDKQILRRASSAKITKPPSDSQKKSRSG
jgi:hypothetical protein